MQKTAKCDAGAA